MKLCVEYYTVIKNGVIVDNCDKKWSYIMYMIIELIKKKKKKIALTDWLRLGVACLPSAWDELSNHGAGYKNFKYIH